MDEQPGEPRDESPESAAAELDDRRRPANRRHAALVEVPEWPDCPAGESRADDSCGVAATLDRRLRDGWKGRIPVPHMSAGTAVLDARQRAAGTAETAAYAPVGTWSLLWQRQNQQVPVAGSFVTRNYFNVLGVAAQLGRMFHPDDDTPCSPHFTLRPG